MNTRVFNHRKSILNMGLQMNEQNLLVVPGIGNANKHSPLLPSPSFRGSPMRQLSMNIHKLDSYSNADSMRTDSAALTKMNDSKN